MDEELRSYRCQVGLCKYKLTSAVYRLATLLHDGRFIAGTRVIIEMIIVEGTRAALYECTGKRAAP